MNLLLRLEQLFAQRFTDLEFLSLQDVDMRCSELGDKVRHAYQPDAIVGILDGGQYPSIKLSEQLNLPLYFISISRPYPLIGQLELDDIFLLKRAFTQLYRPLPQLLQPFTNDVQDMRVLVVDEDTGTGQTLGLADAVLRERGAAETRHATLFSYVGHFQPHFAQERVRLRPNPFCKFRKRLPWCKYSPHYEAYNAFQRAYASPAADSTRCGLQFAHSVSS